MKSLISDLKKLLFSQPKPLISMSNNQNQKMKKYFTILSIIIWCICGTQAQSYQSVISNKSIWTSIDCFRFGPIESKLIRKEMLFGDTIINSISYKKVYRDTSYSFDWNTAKYTCAIREQDKKVYCLPKDEIKENLLYDFNLKVGDYVTVVGMGLNYPNPIKLKVDSVSNKIYNGVNRKIFKFNANGSYHTDETWIEGIGSSFGFLTPFLSVSDNIFMLKCNSKNDTLYYQNNNIGNFLCSSAEPPNSCEYSVISEVNNNKQFDDLVIFPNPTSDYIYIKTDINDLQYSIYNLLGQKLSQGMVINDQIAVSNLLAGVYIIEFNKESLKINRKFIVGK